MTGSTEVMSQSIGHSTQKQRVRLGNGGESKYPLLQAPRLSFPLFILHSFFYLHVAPRQVGKGITLPCPLMFLKNKKICFSHSDEKKDPERKKGFGGA